MNDQLMSPDGVTTLKSFINYVAAFLGIGTFLGFVNLAVGLLSAGWLAVQVYGYIIHELPIKKLRKEILKAQLEQGQFCLPPNDDKR